MLSFKLCFGTSKYIIRDETHHQEDIRKETSGIPDTERQAKEGM